MKHAYYASFTRENIKSSFKRAGICPFEPFRLLSTARPRYLTALDTMVGTEDLMNLFAEKRTKSREKIL